MGGPGSLPQSKDTGHGRRDLAGAPRARATARRAARIRTAHRVPVRLARCRRGLCTRSRRPRGRGLAQRRRPRARRSSRLLDKRNAHSDRLARHATARVFRRTGSSARTVTAIVTWFRFMDLPQSCTVRNLRRCGTLPPVRKGVDQKGKRSTSTFPPESTIPTRCKP